MITKSSSQPCTSTKVCRGANEVWSDDTNLCGNYCQNQYCSYCCIFNRKSVWQCNCADGFARHTNGTCIELGSDECNKLAIPSDECPFECDTVYPLSNLITEIDHLTILDRVLAYFLHLCETYKGAVPELIWKYVLKIMARKKI